MPILSPEQRLAIAIGVPTVAFLLFLWYKRRQGLREYEEEDDEEETEQTSVATVFETSLELKVPASVSGVIIGRGGANIKKIQKETGTYINFKDDDEPKEKDFGANRTPSERTIVIKGEREKARKAELIIKKIVAEQPRQLTEEYLIPQAACGKIIGRGGATIRHLCQVSGARIVVDRSEIRPDVPRKCTVTGTVDQIANAKGLLDETIAEHNAAMARKRMPAVHPVVPVAATPSLAKDPLAASSPAVQFPVVSDYVEVFVSAVDTPGHFWVQLVKGHGAQELDKLVSDLTEEASTGSADSIVQSVKVGEVYCAPFPQDESWYRAKVTKDNNDGTVEVFYVDYGDVGTVPKYRMRKLREEQTWLPFQAVECYLANVKPKDGEWSKEAIDVFKQLTHYPDWQVIMTKAVRYCGATPCLDVYNTTTDKDIYINQEMIKGGFATSDVKYPPSTPDNAPAENAVKDEVAVKMEAADVTDSRPEDVATSRAPSESNTDKTVAFHVTKPVSPKEFSPVKTALVKRVSQDYVGTSPSKKSRTSSELGITEHDEVFEQGQVAPEAAEQLNNEPLEFLAGLQGKKREDGLAAKTYLFGSSERSDTKRSPEKPPLKPEVEEMIKLKVSRAFELETNPAEETEDISQTNQQEGMPEAQDLNAKEDDGQKAVDGQKKENGVTDLDEDDELETFTSSFQQQVKVKTLPVTVTVRNATSETTERDQEHDTGDIALPQYKGAPPLVVVAEQADSVASAPETLAAREEGEAVVESNSSLKEDSVDATVVEAESTPGPQVVISGSEEESEEESEEYSEEESEEESEESDSESFASALEEPGSDTDSTSYQTARNNIESSTTSLEYDTAEGGTDTETLRSQNDTHGTPVNSDTESEGEEYEEDEGEKTPKRKLSLQDSDATPKGSLAAEAMFGSEQELGYKGDTEASTENLHK
ncbi:tudor domain-containing 6-like [Nematostella vectensis]|uniref:tudor domain-containing 6-like n=1 Tax=Nematostella vectensis TaxID=45351 RepID=UPI00138FFF6B|nr:tudor domain-containing 6-like [Nematostella vectensis]